MGCKAVTNAPCQSAAFFRLHCGLAPRKFGTQNPRKPETSLTRPQVLGPTPRLCKQILDRWAALQEKV
jgi:hypothetical protein